MISTNSITWCWFKQHDIKIKQVPRHPNVVFGERHREFGREPQNITAISREDVIRGK